MTKWYWEYYKDVTISQYISSNQNLYSHMAANGNVEKIFFGHLSSGVFAEFDNDPTVETPIIPYMITGGAGLGQKWYGKHTDCMYTISVTFISPNTYFNVSRYNREGTLIGYKSYYTGSAYGPWAAPVSVIETSATQAVLSVTGASFVRSSVIPIPTTVSIVNAAMPNPQDDVFPAVWSAYHIPTYHYDNYLSYNLGAYYCNPSTGAITLVGSFGTTLYNNDWAEPEHTLYPSNTSLWYRAETNVGLDYSLTVESFKQSDGRVSETFDYSREYYPLNGVDGEDGYFRKGYTALVTPYDDSTFPKYFGIESGEVLIPNGTTYSVFNRLEDWDYTKCDAWAFYTPYYYSTFIIVNIWYIDRHHVYLVTYDDDNSVEGSYVYKIWKHRKSIGRATVGPHSKSTLKYPGRYGNG